MSRVSDPQRYEPSVGDAPRTARTLVGCALLATAYWVAGRLGLRLASVNPSASAVWPPSGLALAALLVAGPRLWPGVWLGAFLVNMTTAGSVVTSLGIATGNTLEAVVGAYLVESYANGRHAFDRARDFLRFAILGGLASTTVSAALGVTVLLLAGFASQDNIGSVWLTWWLGDALSVVILAPPLVLWAAGPRPHPGGRLLEKVGYGFTLLLTGGVVFDGLLFRLRGYPLEFICILPLLWGSLRLGLRAAATGSAMLSGMAVWGAAHGFGPFVRETQNEALLLLQAFIAVAAVATQALAALVEELGRARDKQEHRIEERTAALSRANAALLDEVAERQRMEESHRLLFDSSPLPLWVFDLEGSAFVAVNEAAIRHYGYSKEEFLGMTLAEGHPPGTPGLPGALADSPLAVHEGGVWSHRKKDGTLLDVEITSDSLLFNGREARIVVANDVTERLKLERLKEEVSSLMAHDFRSPLVTIRGYSELLLMRVTEDETRRMLRVIDSQARRLADLAANTLAFSQVEAGGIPVVRARVDITDLVRSVVGGQLEQPGVEIVVEASREHITVSGDSNGLHQVVENLVSNAIKYSPGGARIRVSIRETGGGAHVSVADQGMGITPEGIPKLFQKFGRVDDVRRRGIAGTGLGLYICRSIVESHGGRIWVESEPDKGSTFHFWVPVATEPGADPAGKG